MKLILSLIVLVLSALPAHASEKETAFDRIMRTGTIRCIYYIAPPLIIKDQNTGAMSGAFVEYVEAVGKALDLKIEWVADINLGTYLQDLNQGKYDMECATGWPNALRGKQVEYTTPVGYVPFYAFVKDGVIKYDNKLEALNDPVVRFAGHDGGTNSLAQQKMFPKSQLLTVVGDAPPTEPIDMIKFGKADVTMASSFEGENYMKSNPKTIHRVVSEPLRFIPMNMSVAANEFRLVNMINTATNELMYDGTIEKIYQKYHITPETVLRVDKPYEVKK